MLNFNRYIELKKKNVITIKKVNDDFVALIRNFCPETGEELESEEVAVDIKSLEKQKQIIVDAIAGINSLIANLKKL